MRYIISTFICVILLPVMVFTMCSSNNIKKKDDIIEYLDFSYENNKIELSDTLKDKHTRTSESKPSKWKHIIYGGRVYAIDEKGYYHDQSGKIWKPIRVDTTAYTWRDDGDNKKIGAGDGKTATLKDAIRTYGIASGSPIVPRGSILHVSGYGIFEVDDTGGRLRQDWKKKHITTLDLRIPQRRYDGVWRSIKRARAIALKHGRQKDRIVLILIKS